MKTHILIFMKNNSSICKMKKIMLNFFFVFSLEGSYQKSIEFWKWRTHKGREKQEGPESLHCFCLDTPSFL